MSACAIVLGDGDLVRPLAMAGIRCALFGQPDEPARFSRHVDWTLPWIDHWQRPDDVVTALRDFAADRAEPPVLYPQTDGDLLLVSRARERLSGVTRMLLARAELVEDLVDKCRFAALAERHGLPVPSTRLLIPEEPVDVAGLGLRYPCVVKPQTRRADRWGATVGSPAKALAVDSADALAGWWARLSAAGCAVLVQEAIVGPESRIESYHAYVGPDGAVIAEFTGRKLRTSPPAYGHSTAVQITEADDVARLGRDAFARIGLTGVAKADFKRDDDGRLHLLEINPRFTLWHHPAAIAGVNIPALVHADLTGAPRPAQSPLRAGTTWCDPVEDLRAARAVGGSARGWLRWARGCRARSSCALDDPLPFVRGALEPLTRRRLRALRQ